MKGKNFCILPFIHTAIEANGDVKACCLTPTFTTPDNQNYNLNTHSLQEALSSKAYTEFVESFKRDERHPYCSTCWVQEDQGSISNRHKFNRRFAERIRSEENISRELTFLEIKAGNHCNLKCRICGPHNSSKAAIEESDLFGRNRMIHTEQSAWNNNPAHWDAFADLPLDFVHIMGGEPFLNKSHIPMLEKWVASGQASSIALWYNTNATVYPEKLIPLFAQFKKVVLSLSVDDIGPRLEYQRFPAKWDVVKKNLSRFFALDKQKFRAEIDICWSLFNIFYVDEIIGFFDDFLNKHEGAFQDNLRNGRHFYNGDHFCPKTLRPSQRQRLLSRLRNSSLLTSDKYGALVRDLIRHVDFDNYDPETEESRLRRIRLIDAYRGQNFRDTFPEMDFIFDLSL